MPFNREFLDARAKVGFPSRAPLASTRIKADSPSRSLRSLGKEYQLAKKMQLHIKSGYLHIDVSQIMHANHIRVSKLNAVKLARWIIEKFNADTKETNVVRKSEINKRVSSKSAKAASEVED